jgi:PKD repeat protein
MKFGKLLLLLLLFCSSQLSAQVSINANTFQGCAPLTVNFTYNGPTADQWYWDFGDGSPNSFVQNPTHIYTQPTNYWVFVQAYYQSNYIGYAYMQIEVNGIQDSLDALVTNLCPNDVGYFGLRGSQNTNLNSVSWDFGDGNTLPNVNYWGVQHAYVNPGNYTVTATYSTNCGSGVASRYITVTNGPNPIPNSPGMFQVYRDSICPGDFEEFQVAGYDYYLDFGDGNTTQTGGHYGGHQYTVPGIYYPNIIYTNGCGDIAVFVDTIVVAYGLPVEYPPYIDIRYSPACINDPIEFYTNNFYANYVWDFGDGSPTQGNSTLTHSYQNTGIYNVTLTVTNACGSTASSTTTVDIQNAVPLPPFNVILIDSICLGDAINYEVDIQNDDNYSYLWDFGDGFDSHTNRGTYQYLSAGTYNVTLTVSNGCGNTSTQTMPVLVSTSGLIPNMSNYFAQAVPENNSCPGDTVVLAFGPAGDSSVVSWLIDNTITIPATQEIIVGNQRYRFAKHVFTTTGPHTTQCTFTNACGNSGVINDTYNIGNTVQVEADFFFDESKYHCQGEDIVFYAIGGSSYQWDFGDGSGTLVTYSALTPVRHAYALPGLYTVSMKAFNSCGTSDVTTQEILVPPSAISITTNSVSSNCGQSNGTAIVIAEGGNQPYSYVWSNGNSTFLADSLASGIYVVTVSDVNGCHNFGIATVSDVEAPTLVVNTVVDVTCFDGSNGAIDINLIGGNGPFTYAWSNGSTNQDVNNLVAGPHEVIVTDVNGCRATKSIMVDQPAEVILSVVTDKATCGSNDGNAQVNVNGSTGPYYYLWSNGGNNSYQTGLGFGVYTVTVVDNNGCIYTENAIVGELNGPNVVLDSISGTGCLNTTSNIYIRALGGAGPYSYAWSTGATTQNLLGVTAGTYNVMITGGNGCKGVGSFTIEKNQPDGNEICMVTVDTLSGLNHIIWEKDINALDIAYYNIYKESTQSGLYYVVGQVDYDSLSLWVDPVSNSDVRSWRYKLASVDNCGNESVWSGTHKTIHLNVNQGLGNSYNLIWDAYEGKSFGSYDIYRFNANTSAWSYLTTVPNNIFSYTDINPPAGTYSYRVDAVLPGCNPTVRLDHTVNPLAAINNTKSNLKTTINMAPYGVNDDGSFETLNIYPNPSSGLVNISCGIKTDNLKITVLNTVGQVVMRLDWNTLQNSQQTLNMSEFAKGIYIFSFETAEKKIFRKIILQ